jgi:TolB-like protein/tetratricopeptide (TPR) repeat protein
VAGVLFASYGLPQRPVGLVATDATPAIAVLPLTSTSGNAADVELADGFTQELTGILSRSGELRVIANTSVEALLALRLSVSDIADSLRVSHVLDGSVQKNGSRMRLHVRLVDAGDASTRWSNTYDREMRDIFVVLDEVARETARVLGVQVTSEDRSAAQHYTPSRDAIEWYLRGRVELSMGGGMTRDESAKEYFTRAIDADSNFAAAYAGLATVYVRNGDLMRGGEQAALRALALDSTLASAHSALAWARSTQWQWEVTEAGLKRAVALDPNALRGFEGLARLYMFTGRTAEQLAAAQRGLDVDPFSVSAIRELALALSTNGRCDEALQRLLPLKTMDSPASVAGIIRGQCYAQERMWSEAIAEFRWALDNHAPAALGMLGYALGRAGQREEATRILSDLLAGRKEGLGPFDIGLVQAGLGNYDEAFASLEKAAAENRVRPYLFTPMFEELRRDARFDRVKRLMNL